MALLCCALVSRAMPAKPGWHTMSQSDGTTLKVQAVGNAFNSAILTTDGLMVARGADGDFYYSSSLTGLTTVRAHEANQRTPSEIAFIQAQRSNLVMPSESPFSKGRRPGSSFNVGGSNEESGVPAMGSRRIPIILVQFKDKYFNNTRQDIIDAMLSGNESVGQYFRDQSNGLYEPNFEVFGIYTLSQNREYYGGHQGSSNDKYLGGMVTEAVQLAAADGVSFKPYDTNNDDYCDVVIIIYAGVGEAQASTTHPEAVWPCNWNLSSASYYGQGGNGRFRPNTGDPYVDTFAVFNELHGSNDNTSTIDGIGTFCHEFGHCLGLPDFYDTGGGDHYGMGSWDIMCLGCYNNDGYTPPGYSAYEKVFMGWIDYITPIAGTYYTLPVFNQKQAATDKAVCITSNLNQNEYFILENRKKQGWDRYAPGEGIMITHVTYNADRWWANTPNNQDIQLMTLMNADNSWSYYDEGTDLWPQSGKTEFTNNSTPAAKLYMRANGSIVSNAGSLSKPVTEMVINADGTASFWYMKGSATSPVISVSKNEVDLGTVMMGNTGTATFHMAAGALTGPVTLTLSDPNNVFSVNPTTVSATDASNGVDITVYFEPTELQDYIATVTLSSPGAQNVVVTLTGRGALLTATPVMQPAVENFINLTQFRADWTDETAPENVASYTLEVKTKPVISLLETADFSTVPNALTDDGYLDDISGDTDGYLPAGWTCISPLYAYGGCLITSSTIRTPYYDLEGYDKVTVVLNACSYYQSYYGTSTIEVSTSQGIQTFDLGADFANYTIVLDCAANDRISFTTISNYTALQGVTVYAGDLTEAKLNATRESFYRLIPDITNKFYLVKDLPAAGTYVYRVKAIYSDGTESVWSNKQEVTLFENGHGFELGDVNHDGEVAIADVTRLINYLLTGDAENFCLICADVNDDSEVSIADVTSLINKLLTGN